MTKVLFGLLAVISLFAFCNSISSPNYGGFKPKIKNDLSYSDSGKIFMPTDTGMVPSTDYIFDLSIKLPDGYYFDTIIVKDSTRRAKYQLYCLQSSFPGMEKFNNAIRKELLRNVKKDMQLVDTYNGDERTETVYNYELGPFEFFMNDKLLSLCCIVDVYTSGGNHHNYTWYTFNYNLQTNRIIKFNDVFNLNSRKDSVEFIELVKRHRRGTSCVEWGTPFDSVDFSFVKKGICINPELSWACGMQRSFLAPDSLRQFINQKWSN